MNKDEMIQKVKDLIGEGNIDAAKKFVDDHKDDLGEFGDKVKDVFNNFDASEIGDKAQEIFKNLNLDDAVDKAKDVAGDAADAVSDAVAHPEGIIDKIKGIFHHKEGE